MEPFSRNSLRDEIREIYLFSALLDEQLDTVLRGARVQRFETGQQLFRQGDHAAQFFYVRSGTIKLYRLSARGDEKIIEVIRSGQTFAEAVMFMDEGYPVNGEALDPSEVLSFDARSFRRLLRESADTCLRVMATMSRRLRRQVDEIDRLTLQNATCRLVSYLLHESPGSADSAAKIQLTLPKNILASQLAVQPETFSRILSRLSSKGFIDVQGQTITLQNVDGLRDLLRSSTF